jgi:hypothetical protein
MIVVVLVAVYDVGWYPVGKEPRPYTAASLPKLTKVKSLVGYQMQATFARIDGTFAPLFSRCVGCCLFQFLSTILSLFSNLGNKQDVLENSFMLGLHTVRRTEIRKAHLAQYQASLESR